MDFLFGKTTVECVPKDFRNTLNKTFCVIEHVYKMEVLPSFTAMLLKYSACVSCNCLNTVSNF